MLAAVTIGVSTMLAGVTSAGIAQAGGPDPSAYFVHDGSRILGVEQAADRVQTITVYAAAMDREVPLWVLPAADNSVPRPTLYLLNGLGGGEGGNTSWDIQTDIVQFFGDKNVNVVMPMAGRGSWYTDWQREDPVLGRNKWSTFLGRELPPLINDQLNTNQRQSVAGISSSSSTVLNLAMEYPGLFTGVAAYSGCVQSADPVGAQLIKFSIDQWMNGNADNMWGPVGSPDWASHDPELNAEKLRGTDIYMSTGNGIPSYPNDSMDNPRMQDGRATLPDQIVVGGAIEATTNVCTARMASRLADLGIPAVVDFRPTGNHSWGYWQDDLHKSWPWLAGTLGM